MELWSCGGVNDSLECISRVGGLGIISWSIGEWSAAMAEVLEGGGRTIQSITFLSGKTKHWHLQHIVLRVGQNPLAGMLALQLLMSSVWTIAIVVELIDSDLIRRLELGTGWTTNRRPPPANEMERVSCYLGK